MTRVEGEGREEEKRKQCRRAGLVGIDRWTGRVDRAAQARWARMGRLAVEFSGSGPEVGAPGGPLGARPESSQGTTLLRYPLNLRCG